MLAATAFHICGLAELFLPILRKHAHEDLESNAAEDGEVPMEGAHHQAKLDGQLHILS